jgi:hypothetical protein
VVNTVGDSDDNAGLHAYLQRVDRRSFHLLAGFDPTDSIETLRTLAAPQCNEAGVRAEHDRLRQAHSPAEQERTRRRLRARGSGLIADRTRAAGERVRARQAAATVSIGAKTHAFAAVPTVFGRLADPRDRRALSAAYCSEAETMQNDLADLWRQRQQIAIDLGYRSYGDAYAQWKGLDLAGIAALARATLTATESAYRAELAEQLERHAGLDVPDYQQCDTAYLFRGVQWDDYFPAASLRPVTTDAALRLGLDLNATPGLNIDLEARPGKASRPACIAVAVPEEIHIVALPGGGHRDYEALLHELGHAAHFVLADDSLPWEQRCLPDDSVAEAVAYLFGGLLMEPGFLGRTVGMPAAVAHDFTRYARFLECAMVRRYCAKTLYEIEAFEAGDFPATTNRYAELLRDATGAQTPPQLALSDTDPGLYSVQYLTAWFLAAQLRQRLVRDFGPSWYADTAAGSTLQTIWRRANAHTTGSFLADAAGASSLDWMPLYASLMPFDRQSRQPEGTMA